ncbi:MAG: 3-dehydroquinate synthase [Chloroflexi bacterium]|nr:3-dehydroquinate synthase [Chloroflexota bacterium]MCI0794715.1 3-dehydroquinate synthase [Chloroflexota bacterium]MCI0879498.1 3-dehydroquinate synthase [Chloroflexota bacterium]MCI0896157.1 3-dehydroquinate synthase [Chloroflexota bacterium]
MALPRNIILVGFMGTGKSRVGASLAEKIGWEMVDADHEIVRRAGRTIPQIFEQDGESSFRQLERSVIRDLCAGANRVIAAGGGAFADPGNRQEMLASGMVVCLTAQPETIYRRVGHRAGARPMLAGYDPLDRIKTLLEQRAPSYAQAHHAVATDDLTPEQAAEQIVDLSHRHVDPARFPEGGSMADADLAAVVRHSGGSYPLVAGWGFLEDLGPRFLDLGIKSPVYIITDSNVMNPYGRRVQRGLQKYGIAAHCFVIPAGEPSKSFAVVQSVYDWLVERRAERGQAIIAVGGGVVGDLAGFVAATYLRGVPFVQVPTSMAAMVDASIGGKVAVNLPQAKNLVGAFYQPQGVFADVETLSSLGKRELAEGWAEAIKHGFILDAALVDVFEEHAEALMDLEPEISTQVIRRSMAIKAEIVSEDERETLGIRILLNYGHTIGHALEASTEYGSFFHGEGVSVGMMGAARIAQQMGMISGELVDRHHELLRRFSLPTSASAVSGVSGLSMEGVLRAMALDKKVEGGGNRWVLLEGVGKAVVRRDVPKELVEETIKGLIG